MSKKGDTGESQGMKGLWKDMEQQTRVRMNSRRSRSQPGKMMSINHVLISSTSNSSSWGSTHSSTATSTVSNSSEDIGMEGQAARPRVIASAQSPAGPYASSTSASSSAAPSGWDQGENSAYTYHVPHGFVVKNSFLEPIESAMDLPDEYLPASAYAPLDRLRMMDADLHAPGQPDMVPCNAVAEEEILSGPVADHPLMLPAAEFEFSVPQEDVQVRDHEQESTVASSGEAVAKQKNKRPRPPKPKRELAKRLAEFYFAAQQGESDEQREIAEQLFLMETSSDQKLHEYARNVLRRLNSEARDRETSGENPLPTSVDHE